MGHGRQVPEQSVAQRFANAQREHQAGRLAEALALYHEVVTLAPDHADAHHLLGLLLTQRGDRVASIAHLQRAVALQAANPLFHNTLGETWRRQGELAAAEQSFRRALTLAPGLPEAHYNLANVLKQQERLEEAVVHYRQAVQIRPTYANAHYNLGNVLLALGRLSAAETAYGQALALRPQWALAYNNLGVVLREQVRTDDAIAAYRAAIQCDPASADAHRNLGLALERQGEVAAAKEYLAVALRLAPPNDLAALVADSLAPVIPQSVAEIDNFRADLVATIRRYDSRPLQVDLAELHHTGGEPPFVLAYQGRDDLPIKTAWASLFRDAFPQYARSVGTGKAHIGVVVTHGHEGVFAKCMRGVLNHLGDRFRLTVVCSRQAGAEILRPLITNPAVNYLPLPQRFDQAVALLAQAQFDLLHFWEVGTDATNYFLPFCRLAPVQATTWGWPVTSGIPQLDYFVSAQALETAASDSHYSEQLVRLGRLPTYYYRPTLPTPLPPRHSLGLDDGAHIYLCPQNLRKVHPDFDPLVAALLRQDLDGQVCFIDDQEPQISNLLRRRLTAYMPDVADRIRFLPRMDEAQYLAVTAHADVVLDTLYYGGGANTTYDAFAVGTPIVTLPFGYQRSRWAAAAYEQMGVQGPVAASVDEYVALALQLGTDPTIRAELSKRINAHCAALFEDLGAVHELADWWEQALEQARG